MHTNRARRANYIAIISYSVYCMGQNYENCLAADKVIAIIIRLTLYVGQC